MTQAGDLTFRITFAARASGSDEYGESEGEFTDRFSRWGALTPRLGGERILADRLAGIQSVTIVVPWDDSTKTIAANWRATDVSEDGAGTVYDIKSAVDRTGRREWIEILAQSGGAA
jgi:head-tail adaptor